jgi:hypothetical protein
MNVTLNTVPPGWSIAFAGKTWTVLEHDEDLCACLCLCDSIVGYMPFDKYDRNNFLVSTCYQEFLRNPEDRNGFPISATAAEVSSYLPSSPIDLTAASGAKIYGAPTVTALFLLTLAQYRHHKDIIPGADRPWWLATAAIPTEDAVSSVEGHRVCTVSSDGRASTDYAKATLGIRPACWLREYAEVTLTGSPMKETASPPTSGPLGHVKMLDDVEHYIGGGLLSVETILFNSNHIPPEEALRLVRAGEYSPYVLAIPKEQFYGLFKDQPVKASERLQKFEAGRSGT